MARSGVSGVAAALGIVALCLVVGGWPWAAIAAAGCCWLIGSRFDARSVLLTACLSLVWLALFLLTGDRRLFFPFAIQFAMQAGFARRAGSLTIVGLFLLIRIAQGASLHVLAVELAVAAVVVAISLGAYRLAGQSWGSRLGWAGFGSVLAFLGLSI